jgi:hypothetical protein
MQLVRYLVAYEFTYFIGLYIISLQAQIDYYKDYQSTYENISSYFLKIIKYKLRLIFS